MQKMLWLLFVIVVSSCNKALIYYAGPADLVQTESADNSKACNLSSSYIPDPQHLNATPIRYVRVNFHIMQASDGSGNFSEAEGKKFVHELVDHSNYRWSNNLPMNLPEGNTTATIPIPIRIVLQKDPVTGEDAIYFHRNDTLAFWNRSLKKGIGALNDRSAIDRYRTGGDSIINIFMIEHVPDSIGSATYGEIKLSGISFMHSLKLFSQFYLSSTPQYDANGQLFRHDMSFFSKILNHELGHCFNLNHTWNWDDGCDDTPKNPGCWQVKSEPPCDGLITNNMMDYNWSQQAVSPCQIGRMEYFFWKDDNGAREFVIPNWCTYHPQEKVIVYRNEDLIWSGGKDLLGDIEVREGATLTIRCRVSLPAGAKIILKPGAVLHMDGGTLTNMCGDKFKAIEIWEDKKTGEKGAIRLSNNGSIENIEIFPETIQYLNQ